MNTASRKRSAGDRRRGGATRAMSPSVGSTDGAPESGRDRQPPSRTDADRNRPPVKNATKTLKYHDARNRSREVPMEPEDGTATLPLDVAAALPEAAPAPAVLDGLVPHESGALTAQPATFKDGARP